jgi:hypothetical protein
MIRTYFVFCLIVLLAAGDLHDKELPPQSSWDLRTFEQELPDQIRQDAYIQEFVKIIQRWNTEATKFPSYGELRAHYKANLEQAVEQKWQTYTSAEWAEGKLKQFDQLATIPSRPQLKLDREAALTLTLAFAINLTSIRSKYKAESLDKELTLPSYIIFTESQKLALKAKRSFITSEDVSRTIFRWWTTVWPFCAPPEKKA